MRPTIKILAALLLIQGCSLEPRIASPDDLYSKSLITAGDKVRIQVRGIADRVEPTACIADYQMLRTGLIWSEVFVGIDGDPVLTVIETSLSCSTLRTELKYTVKAKVEFKGQSFPVEVSGVRSVMNRQEKANRDAVELGVIAAAVEADKKLTPFKNPAYR